jgi:hypothetical protein
MGGWQGRNPLPLHLTNARARAGPGYFVKYFLLRRYYEGHWNSWESGEYLINHFIRHYEPMKKITGKVGGTNGVPSYTYHYMSPIRYGISS